MTSHDPLVDTRKQLVSPLKIPKISFGAGDNLGVTKEYVGLFEYLGQVDRHRG